MYERIERTFVFPSSLFLSRVPQDKGLSFLNPFTWIKKFRGSKVTQEMAEETVEQVAKTPSQLRRKELIKQINQNR